MFVCIIPQIWHIMGLFLSFCFFFCSKIDEHFLSFLVLLHTGSGSILTYNSSNIIRPLENVFSLRFRPTVRVSLETICSVFSFFAFGFVGREFAARFLLFCGSSSMGSCSSFIYNNRITLEPFKNSI